MYSYLSFGLAWILFASDALAAAATSPSGVADLKGALTQPSMKWSSQTVLSFPGQSTFENATERWTTFDAPTYFASVTVGNEVDVANAVGWIRYEIVN